MIKVLIIDDSALMRQLLADLLSQAADIKVVGTAPDPLVAREKIKILQPDVLTLDIEMPRMDGLDFLEKLMRLRPMPVVMVSTLTAKGAEITLKALELGAVDYIHKPDFDITHNTQQLAATLQEKVRAAAGAKVRSSAERGVPRPVLINKQTTQQPKPIFIGSSTGGVEALAEIIPTLPKDAPPVVIVQHMPAMFLRSFAARLATISQVRVLNPIDRQILTPGHAYLAPGDVHAEIAESTGGLQIRLIEGPPVGNHRPAVNVLFHSVAKVAGARAVGVMLTGMGKDGAEGMLAMRQAGARTLGQNEASCVVYGMPKAAFELGAVEEEVGLAQIPQRMLDLAYA